MPSWSSLRGSFPDLACVDGFRDAAEVKVWSFGRHKLSQAARVGWSHRRRAILLCSPQCQNFPLGQKGCGRIADETVGAVFRASGKFFPPVSEVVRKYTHSAKKHCLQRQRGGPRPWGLAQQKLLSCRLAGWTRLLENSFRLSKGGAA